MAQLSLTVLRCPDYGSAEQRLVRGVELTIGRGTECDWALPDPLRSLSRKHCRLEQVGAAWQVVDLSANGTFINFDNEPIGRDQAQPVRDGDRLRLGDYELEVRLAQDSVPATDSPFDPAVPASGFGFGGGVGEGVGLGGASGLGAAGLDPAPDQGLFGAVPRSGGLGASPVSGGFGSARLPGLDDPVAPGGDADGLDLDISGGLGSFTPAPAYGAQEDHVSSTGDAYRPPAVMPADESRSATPESPGGQAIVPDDWLQSLALSDVAPAPFSPVTGVGSLSAPPSPPPDPDPWPGAPANADPLGPGSPFDDLAPAASPTPAPGADDSLPPFDHDVLASTQPGNQPGFRPGNQPAGLAARSADWPGDGFSAGPGASPASDPAPGHAPDAAPAWREPVDVPLSGPGPGPAAAEAPTPAAVTPGMARAPSVSAPPVPPAAASRATGGDPLAAALAALLTGGGLSVDAVPRAAQDPEAALRHAGALMQAAVAGLRALLVARGLVKREFRIEQTMLRPKENNPLKFAASDEHALASLLDPRLAGLKAVQDAVEDLSSHEVAVLAATQAAAHALLQKLSPEALETEDPGGSGLFGASAEKRLWLAYKRRHATLMAQLEDDFDSAFGIAFARAYEQAESQRKG